MEEEDEDDEGRPANGEATDEQLTGEPGSQAQVGKAVRRRQRRPRQIRPQVIRPGIFFRARDQMPMSDKAISSPDEVSGS